MRGGPACFGGSGLSLLKEEDVVGVVKAWLRDDPEMPEWADRPTAYDPVPVVTDEDPPPATETSVNPVLTVRLRVRSGYDDNDNPTFEWTTLIEDAATILWTDREEFDAAAGFTKERAKATMLYDGPVSVPETASVSSDDGRQWRVLAVRQVPGRLEFDLERLT